MTQESVRGLLLIVWASSVWHLPSMHALQFYGQLAELVSWLGHPQTVFGLTGWVIGLPMIAAAERDWQVARRGTSILGCGYWLLVASGFAESSPTVPATIIYYGIAALHVRTALGLPVR